MLMFVAPDTAIPDSLSSPSLASVLGVTLFALLAVFYAMLRGKLRPESSLREVREDRDARVREAREDRDARLADAKRQIEMWQNAHTQAEAARQTQEALLRDTTMEIGRTVQHVLTALNDARIQVSDGEPGNTGRSAQDA